MRCQNAIGYSDYSDIVQFTTDEEGEKAEWKRFQTQQLAGQSSYNAENSSPENLISLPQLLAQMTRVDKIPED